MKCPNCGFDNLGFEKTCLNCGASLKKYSKKAKTQTKSQPKSFLFIVAGLLVLLLFVFLFITGRFKPSDPSITSINQLTEQQIQALQRLSESSSEETSYYSRDGIIRFASMQVAVANIDFDDPVAVAIAFLEQHSDLLQIEDISNQLFPAETYSLHGGTLVHFRQEYEGIPVLGSDLIVEVDNQGNALSIHGGYSPNLNVPTQPALSSEEAFNIISAELDHPKMDSDGELVIYDTARLDSSLGSVPRLAWLINVISDDGIDEYVIDAKNGMILAIVPSVVNMEMNVRVFDSKGERWLEIYNDPDKFQLLDDKVKNANQVRGNLDTIESYFSEFSSMNETKLFDLTYSIDVYLNVSSMCDKNQNGANMDPNKGFMFLCPNSTSIDVVAHEFTHYLTHRIGPKYGRGAESAALNESYSDIFAAFVTNYHNQDSDDYNDPWVISFGDEGGYLIRDIRNLPDDGYPNNYQKWVRPSALNKNCRKGMLGLTKDSNEAKIDCAHMNSTIHTYAAYLIERKIGFEKTGIIFYHTLMNGFLAPNDDYFLARKYTHRACIDLINKGLFDISEQDCDVVLGAFDSVGITDPITSILSPFTVVTETPQETSGDKEILPDKQSSNGIKNGKIIIESRCMGFCSGSDLLILNSDGSGKKYLTDTNLGVHSFDISYCENTVVFQASEGMYHEVLAGETNDDIIKTNEIYSINLDGTGFKQLTRNNNYDANPNFSPDGQLIVYVSTIDDMHNIMMMNSDGSNQKILVNYQDYIRRIQWAPDSKSIFYNLWSEINSDIYEFELDTMQQMKITNNDAPGYLIALSPNNELLLFVNLVDDKRQLRIMNRNGNDPMLLAEISNPVSNLRWSPDSQKISYVTEYRLGNYDISLIDVNTTNQIQITNNEGNKTSFHYDWFPDSKNFMYTIHDHNDNSSDFYIFSFEDNESKNIFSSGEYADEPRVSPDGEKIIFSSNFLNENFAARDLFTIDVDGSNFQRLTDNERSLFVADWLPIN